MLTLYLIRHGPAAPHACCARDAERPLTAEGVELTTGCARGLAELARPQLVLTSPLVRARQTAELLAQAVEPTPKIVSLDELAGVDEPDELLAIAERHNGDEIALVGHEPDMSRLAGHLLAGRQAMHIDFKKAAVCRIDVARPIRAGAGTLVWLIPPRVLTILGRG